MPDELEFICPECWTEGTIEAVDEDKEISCQECGYKFFIEDGVQ